MEGKDYSMLLWWLALVLMAAVMASGRNVTYDGRSLIVDGQHKILFSGSIHYPRSTPEVCNEGFPLFYSVLFDYVLGSFMDSMILFFSGF